MSILQAQGCGYTAKNCWPTILCSEVLRGKCTPSRLGWKLAGFHLAEQNWQVFMNISETGP